MIADICTPDGGQISDELWTIAGIEKTDWAQRRTLKVGTCASAPVWWDELDQLQ